MEPDVAAPAPLVSVIVPVFNGADTVRVALRSLLQQSLTALEVVVIDDGSSDGTAQFLREMAGTDHRVRIVTHESNQGLVASLNTGLQHARGSLIARLDADDVARPTRLQRQADVFAADPSVALCATGYRRVLTDGTVVSQTPPPADHAAFAATLLTGNCICHSSVMMRRDAVVAAGAYKADLFPVEDFDLWIRLIDHGTYVGVPSIEVDYLQNPHGVSSTSTVQIDMAQRRAADYCTTVLGSIVTSEQVQGLIAPSKPWRARVRTVRLLNRLSRALSQQLRSRNVAVDGVFWPLLGHALQVFADVPRLMRWMAVAVLAPHLACSSARSRHSARRPS